MSESRKLRGGTGRCDPTEEQNVISARFGGRKSAAYHVGHELPPEVRDCVDILTDACGDNLVALIFFGSRLLGTSPNDHSAADLFVIVEDYTRFYVDVGRRLPARRRASIMAVLNRILPPNIISLRDPADLRAGAKCFIVSHAHWCAAMSRGARDNFFRGRMLQRFQIVYARSRGEAQEIERGLHQARRMTLEWVPLYLGDTFTVLEYCRRMLEVSYSAEIRPESRSRVSEVFGAQQDYFRLAYGRILNDAVEAGRLIRVRGGYRLGEPVTFIGRLRWRAFFQRSRVRATVRWAKYMLTFDDWLDYIVRKIERRTGLQIELTPAERRFPAILLWPKAIRVFKAMRSKGGRGTRVGGEAE